MKLQGLVFGTLAVLWGGWASGAVLGPIGTYYVAEGSPGGLDPARIWALKDGTVARTDLALSFSNPNGLIIVAPGPIATYGDKVAVNGSYGTNDRQAQTGQILSGAPGLTLTDTGVYPRNTTISTNFFDGTSDGVNYNYMISDTGVIYRAGLDWSNPTQMGIIRQRLTYSGITYDRRNGTLWATGNWPEAGGFLMYNFTLPENPNDFVNLRRTVFRNGPGETFVGALAMDLDYTFWMTDLLSPGKLLNFTEEGGWRGTFIKEYMPSDPPVRMFGGEIAGVIPEPGMLGLLVPAAGVMLRRRNARV